MSLYSMNGKTGFKMSGDNERYWETKSLAELSQDEWESLCDGCGQCCLIKLEDEDTGEVYRTNVSCQLLDLDSCRCMDYGHRFEKVPECVQVSLEKTDQFEWMPETCAYRLLYEGKPLFDWHPLLSTDKTVEIPVSVKHIAISEEYIHPSQYEDHIAELIK